jgi:hypothetical protein
MNEKGDSVDTDTNWVAADPALAVWLEMWNTDAEIARRICSADFRIHFLNSDSDGSNPADDVLGAESFSRYFKSFHESHPGMVFTEVSRAVDGAHGRMLWNVRAGDHATGGVDVFDFTEDGLIREVWSVGGTRTHPGGDSSMTRAERLLALVDLAAGITTAVVMLGSRRRSRSSCAT